MLWSFLVYVLAPAWAIVGLAVCWRVWITRNKKVTP